MKKPNLKTNKEPFYNILLRFFRDKKCEYVSINSSQFIITAGHLSGLLIKPNRQYVAVSRIANDFDSSKVKISIDVFVNYSVEAFMYALYRFKLINQTVYAKLVANHV